MFRVPHRARSRLFPALFGAVCVLFGAVWAVSRTPSPPASTASPPPFLENVSLPAPTDAFTLVDQATDTRFTCTAAELLPAALACEMDPNAPEEALKAQAVATYTLFAHRRAAGEEIRCDSAQCLVWTDQAHLSARWGEDFDALYGRLCTCCQAVSGELLTAADGAPILPTYFAISAGATQSPEDVWGGSLPCLSPVASPGDCLADGYLSTCVVTPAALETAARSAFPDKPFDFTLSPDQLLVPVEKNPSGYIRTVRLAGVELTGAQLRQLLGLRSAAADWTFEDGAYHFTVRGWGHGVGMSQAGASFLARQGRTYQEILAHYYPTSHLVRSRTD